jgi:hypothetical protein
MIRIFTLLVSLLFCYDGAFAQSFTNLVPNPSFEIRSQCPNGLDKLSLATGWDKPTDGTSDYYNVCGGNGAGVPLNQMGVQSAYSGQAYAGCIAYFAQGNNYREYLRASIPPLMPGRNYKVGMHVSTANYSGWACNGLGVFFYKQDYPRPATFSGLIPVTAQVSYASYGVITDTLNWVHLTKTFVPDSSYEHIIIGGIAPDAGLGVNNFNPFGSTPTWAYYYIDSVYITLLDGMSIAPLANNLFCSGDPIQVSFVVSGNPYTASNIFRLQLSDPAGSFDNPIVIGTRNGSTGGTITGSIPPNMPTSGNYLVRIVSTNMVDSTYSLPVSIGNAPPAAPIVTSNSPLCVGGSLALNATSPTPGITHWDWVGPSSFTSQVQNPTRSVNVADAGNYNLQTSIYGCKSPVVSTPVTVNPLPAAPVIAATATPYVCVGATITRTATSNTPGVTFSWTGPNGFTHAGATISRPNADLSMSGTYRVRATTAAGCSTSTSVAVTVSAYPVITGLGPGAVCEGASVVLSASSNSAGTTYSWSGPLGFTSNLAMPPLTNTTPAMSGNYVVTGTYRTCATSFTVPVTVKPYPVVPVAGSNSPVCTGTPLNLYSTASSPGVTWDWTGPASFSSTQFNPVLLNSTMGMAGDYIVTATLNGCSKKDTVTVVMKQTPSVSGTANTPVCEGQALNLSASSPEPQASLSWSGPLSYFANSASAVLGSTSVAMSGNYIATATHSGCSSTHTVPVIINPTPVMPVLASNSPACDELRFTATGTPGATYAWVGPMSFTSILQNPVLPNATPANNGIYTVIASLGNCSAPPASIQATVNAKPYLGAYASPNDTVCEGTVVTFVTVPMNGIVNPQFQWFKNNVLVPGQTNLTYIGPYASGDEYYCRTYAQDLCNNNITLYSNKITMQVIPVVNNLSATISSTPATPLPGQFINFMCTVVSGGYTPKFQWRKNGQDIFGAIHANWSANNLAPYDEITCHVITSDPCASPTQTLSNKVIINFPTSVTDVDSDGHISVYPNPNTGTFTVKSMLHTIKQLEVVNSIGQQVYSQQATGHELNITLPVSLANGVYIIKIDTEAGIIQQRFALQR